MPVMALGTGGSLYKVLRVEPTAKVYHLDLSGNGRDFTEIHNTYEALSDPKAKAVYDMSLVSRRRTRTTSFGCSGRSRFHPTHRWETNQCWYEFSI
ncbi:hypothetical protein AB3S75_015341 [Citrus x aurantiifolia]